MISNFGWHEYWNLISYGRRFFYFAEEDSRGGFIELFISFLKNKERKAALGLTGSIYVLNLHQLFMKLLRRRLRNTLSHMAIPMCSYNCSIAPPIFAVVFELPLIERVLFDECLHCGVNK